MCRNSIDPRGGRGYQMILERGYRKQKLEILKVFRAYFWKFGSQQQAHTKIAKRSKLKIPREYSNGARHNEGDKKLKSDLEIRSFNAFFI